MQAPFPPQTHSARRFQHRSRSPELSMTVEPRCFSHPDPLSNLVALGKLEGFSDGGKLGSPVAWVAAPSQVVRLVPSSRNLGGLKRLGRKCSRSDCAESRVQDRGTGLEIEERKRKSANKPHPCHGFSIFDESLAYRRRVFCPILRV